MNFYDSMVVANTTRRPEACDRGAWDCVAIASRDMEPDEALGLWIVFSTHLNRGAFFRSLGVR